jgi:hypothetical protein
LRLDFEHATREEEPKVMNRFQVPMAFVALFVISSSASAQWQEFKSDEYGFRMLVPGSTEGVAKDFGGGWGGMYFEAGAHTKVYGVAKLGPAETPEAVRAFGATATGIPADQWKQESKGTDWNGFTWYEVYSAEGGGKVMGAYLGAAPKGSYFIYMETTPEEYEASQAAFEKWEESIHVY